MCHVIRARNTRRSLHRALAAFQRLGAPEVHASSGDWTAAWSEAETLWQAVRRLSAADQDVIYLRFFLDLSESEMARTLEVAPGTVKSRLSRALGRLRTVIAAEFPALRAEDER